MLPKAFFLLTALFFKMLLLIVSLQKHNVDNHLIHLEQKCWNIAQKQKTKPTLQVWITA